jgi:hypothetical protein
VILTRRRIKNNKNILSSVDAFSMKVDSFVRTTHHTAIHHSCVRQPEDLNLKRHKEFAFVRHIGVITKGYPCQLQANNRPAYQKAFY